MPGLKSIISVFLCFPVLAAVAFPSGAVQAQNTDKFEPPLRLYEKTLKPADPPLDLPVFVGWFCQAAGKSANEAKPIDWSYLDEILVGYQSPVRANTKEGKAKSEADFIEEQAAAERFARFTDWHQVMEPASPREYFNREFKNGDYLLPRFKLNPAPGRTQSVFFHRCVTDEDLAAAKKAIDRLIRIVR